MNSIDQLAIQMLSEHGHIRVAVKASRSTSVAVDEDDAGDWSYTFSLGPATDCEIQTGWHSSVSQTLAAAARHVLTCNQSTPAAQALARELLQALPAGEMDE